jgi:hypothetical protein
MAKSLPKVEEDVEVSTNQAPLIRADRALESSRDAGFDLNAASGEPVDNSIEAGARRIHIEAFKVGRGGGSRHRESISEIAFADDGTGIPHNILANTLTVGFSTRYGSRKGLGRFGMGLKLAALSQGRRLEIYTKPAGSQQIFYAYFDLDEISSGMQKFICAVPTDAFPEKYVHLMRDDDGNEFTSGTLVVWSKVDRLEHAGHYGIAVDERLRDLTKYLARTYRKFLINGLIIKLQGRQIMPHDPLCLLETPLAVELLGPEEWQAELLDFKPIEINGHKVEMTVTLLPEKVRLVKGEGGNRGSVDTYKPLHIADNEGCVSIMRNGREIYYNIIPKLLPGARPVSTRSFRPH